MTIFQRLKRNMILISLQLIVFHTTNGQIVIKQDQLYAIVKVKNYYYDNNTYVVYSPVSNYTHLDKAANALSALQARYDRAYNILSVEYSKLMNLALVNDYNMSLLEETRIDVKKYSDAHFTKVDLSVSENFTSWLNYITWIYSIPSIKAEITLLNAVNNELFRIRGKDPEKFHKSERFSELMKTIAELKTIDKDSISTLSWKYGLF